MSTLKEFEKALRSYNMVSALAVLEELRKRDKAKRTIAAPARRIAGKKMTPELARAVVEMHKTTAMTQQEIAFKLGVNQGRVNEVIKHGKWLTADPKAPEAQARDKALKRMRDETKPADKPVAASKQPEPRRPIAAKKPAQLMLGDF